MGGQRPTYQAGAVRKTDVKDAEWIATLMRMRLLNNSFIPGEEQRDLRYLTRYRTRLTNERSAAVNLVQKVLEDANIKLSSVVTDIKSVSALRMLEAIIAGTQDSTEIAEIAKSRLRSKIPELVEALTGRGVHHRFMLQELLQHVYELNRAYSNSMSVSTNSLHRSPPPGGRSGVGEHTAEVLLAEIGDTV